MPVADFSLSGKVAIVTGGSRGIGRSIALGLAEQGADVAIAARKPDALAEAAEAVSRTGRRAIAVPTNVRRTEELANLVERTRAELGRIDVLVNNAGTNPVFGPVHEIDESGVERRLDPAHPATIDLAFDDARPALAPAICVQFDDAAVLDDGSARFADILFDQDLPVHAVIVSCW